MRKDLWDGNKEEGIFFSVCELILPSLGKSLRSIARYSPGEEEGRMFGEDHVVFKGNGVGSVVIHRVYTGKRGSSLSSLACGQLLIISAWHQLFFACGKV